MTKSRNVLLTFSLILSSALPLSANDKKIVQFYLNNFGYNAGPVDGIPGRKTQNAIREFYSSTEYEPTTGNYKTIKRDLIDHAIKNDVQHIHYGLCDATITPDYQNSQALDSSFNLQNHQLIKTYIPPYRSFSFGKIDTKIGNNSAPEIKTVGDVNLDGIDDIIIDYYETFVPPVILYGTKSGRFEVSPLKIPEAARRHIRNANLADFNNDGYPDFVGFTTGDDGRWWKSANGDPKGFDVPNGERDLLMVNSADGTFSVVQIPEEYTNAWNHGGTAVDIDGDGMLDIVSLVEGTANRSGMKVSKVIRNLGDLNFEFTGTSLSSDINKHLTSDIDSADFNNDGYSDLVVIIRNSGRMSPTENNKLGTIRVIYGDGDFDFSNNLETAFGAMWITEKQAEEVMDYNETEAYELSDQDGINLDVGSSNVDVIDVDGDGLVDILESQYFSPYGVWFSSGFKFYRNTGLCFEDATDKFFPNQNTNRNYEDNAYTSFVHNFFQGDLNGDGREDLVLQTDGMGRNIEVMGDHETWLTQEQNPGYPYVFIQQENGQFLPIPRSRPDVEKNLTLLKHLVVGDFNGDGRPDIAGIRKPPFTDPLQGEKAFVYTFLNNL